MESPKRSSASSSSSLHEFEFWKVGRNPSSFLPSPEAALTADELFVDGVLLPLHFLSLHPKPDRTPVEPDLLPLQSETEPEPKPEPHEPEPAPDTRPAPSLAVPAAPLPSDASITASVSCSLSSGSKRWKGIFKIGEKKDSSSFEDKELRKERRGGAGAAEQQLHISIWPFSRSRSAGNGSSGGRRRVFGGGSGRMVSSAPCSRSNSRGESSKHSATAGDNVARGAPGTGARRWAASPGRSGGVPVGRASPVWQVPRATKAAGWRQERKDRVTGNKKTGGGGIGVRVLNLNVNTCIGYRGQVSCRGEDKDGVTAAGERTAGEGSGNLFGLRTLFSKKVY